MQALPGTTPHPTFFFVFHFVVSLNANAGIEKPVGTLAAVLCFSEATLGLLLTLLLSYLPTIYQAFSRREVTVGRLGATRRHLGPGPGAVAAPQRRPTTMTRASGPPGSSGSWK